MKRVLAIVHQSDAGPGVFADAVQAAGAALEQWCPPQQEQPPVDPFAYDAVMTFGGAMHPDQDGEHPWLVTERAVLAELVERGVPLLGVCLGAELLAAAVGASPRRLPAAEIGWCRVDTTDDASSDPLIAPLAPGFDALEWHSYASPLPPGATALACSAACLQAYRIGAAAWGIQFHAEVTAADFDAWLTDYRSDPDAVRGELDAGQLRARTHAAIAGWNELGRELCGRFLAVAG